jgi:cytidylate kinase
MHRINKPLIVTISGDLGSGKSVLANALMNYWSAESYSTGKIQREMAEQRGITTLELNKLAETDKSIDDEIDGNFRKLSQTDKNLVIDSRMAWHFIPESFKIKLEVNPVLAAERIIAANRSNEKYGDFDATLQGLKDRKLSERERFQKYYNVDIEDQDNYDLVIETTDVTPQAIQIVANDAIKDFLISKPYDHFWVGARNLIPSKNKRDLHETVTVTRKDGFYVILNGHKRVTKALDRGYSLTPCIRIPNHTLPNLDPQVIQTWQDKNDFTFAVDPKRLVDI